MFPGIKHRILDDQDKTREYVNIFVNGENIRDCENENTRLKAGDVSSSCRLSQVVDLSGNKRSSNSGKAKKTGNTTMLLVGTRKGAFIFASKDGRKTWKVSGPHFRESPVYHIVYDNRNGLILASVASLSMGTEHFSQF